MNPDCVPAILAILASLLSFSSPSSPSSLPIATLSSSAKTDSIRIGFLVSSNNGKDKLLMESYKSAAREALVKTTSWINERVALQNQSDRKSSEGYGNMNVSVMTAWEDPGYCDEQTALGRTVILHKARADVFVGPFCLESLKVVTLLGSFWNTTVVTWSPYLRSTYEKKSEEKVVSLFGAFEDFVHATHLVLEHLRWNKIAIIYEKEHDLCSLLVEDAMRQNLYQAQETDVMDIISVSHANVTHMEDRLDKVKRTTRTTLLCMTHKTLHEFMVKAEAMDMLSGYYGFMYLNFDPWPYNLTVPASHKAETSVEKVLDKVLVQFGQFPDLNHYHAPHIDAPAPVVYRNGSDSIPWTGDDLEVAERFQLKPYFHDAVAYAILLARHQHLKKPEPKYFNASFLKTGPIHLEDSGMRRPQFTLVHHRDGKCITVAKVTDSFELVTMDALAWIKNSLPPSALDCHSPYASCSSSDELIAGVVSAVVITLVIIIAAIIIYMKYWKRKCGPETEWIVDDSEVLRKKLKSLPGNAYGNGTPSPINQKKKLCRMETRMTLGLGSLSSLDKNMLYAPVANYRGMVVAVKHVRWTHAQLLKGDMLHDLKILKETSHDNLNQFVGAHVSHMTGESYVLFRYCAKGSLQDVLENDDIKLDWMFKLSFALDLARGMEYLHKSPLRSHGNLKSSNCVIDSRWVLKVTDYGSITSYKKVGKDLDVDEREFNLSLLWTAPELLRLPKRPHKGTQKGDIYSFGIILQEILLRSGPFFHNNMEPDDIITLVKKAHMRRPYRPAMPAGDDSPPLALQLMVSCWAECPDLRPDFHNICKKLLSFNGAKRFNILDNMLSLLESYSSNLEQLVAERTEELEAEKRKTDSLLYQMLPPSVAEQLKSGRHVIPESFENVSIFFSDIVGFTAMASESKPLEVVDVLNDLYTCFDDIIARRDVYKVETIGDAYMVVSGCPVRNGERHAGEIANMALDLVSAVCNFRIRHRPAHQLNLRVGLHKGPCAAGVVGRTMPRYCLFGDTVNMASRMESTGKALHIHMSGKMNEAVTDLDWGFITVDRGFIEVKGKGLQKTFWLVGKENYNRPLPDAMTTLRKSTLDDRSPAPSVCSLNVEDSMFSALRKTSITSSSITLENVPATSSKVDHVFHQTPHKYNDSDAPTAATRRKTLKRRFATAQSPSFPDDVLIGQIDNVFVGKDANTPTGNGNDDDNNSSNSISTTPYKKDSACYSIMSDHNSEPDLSNVETTGNANKTHLSQPNINVHNNNNNNNTNNVLPKHKQLYKAWNIDPPSRPPREPNHSCHAEHIPDCGCGGNGGGGSHTNVHFSDSSGQERVKVVSSSIGKADLPATKNEQSSNNSSIGTTNYEHGDCGIPRIEIS